MTRRQEIIQLLEKQPKTLNSLAQMYGVRHKEILNDLKHIEKSIRPKKLIIERESQILIG